MTTATKVKCFTCERPADRTAIVVTNLYDGGRVVMDRRCILRVIDKIAQDEGDEDLAAQLHHQLNVQGIFRDSDAARQKALDGKDPFVNPVLSEIQMRLDTMPEPVVEQRDSNTYNPSLDEDDEPVAAE